MVTDSCVRIVWNEGAQFFQSCACCTRCFVAHAKVWEDVETATVTGSLRLFKTFKKALPLHVSIQGADESSVFCVQLTLQGTARRFREILLTPVRQA